MPRFVPARLNEGRGRLGLDAKRLKRVAKGRVLCYFTNIIMPLLLRETRADGTGQNTFHCQVLAFNRRKSHPPIIPCSALPPSEPRRNVKSISKARLNHYKDRISFNCFTLTSVTQLFQTSSLISGLIAMKSLTVASL